MEKIILGLPVIVHLCNVLGALAYSLHKSMEQHNKGKTFFWTGRETVIPFLVSIIAGYFLSLVSLPYISDIYVLGGMTGITAYAGYSFMRKTVLMKTKRK
jgi:hypothetical protein